MVKQTIYLICQILKSIWRLPLNLISIILFVFVKNQLKLRSKLPMMRVYTGKINTKDNNRIFEYWKSYFIPHAKKHNLAQVYLCKMNINTGCPKEGGVVVD